MNKKAFSLVELLVVIGILAILCAIAFPVFKSVKDASLKTACVSNMKQLYVAMDLYYQDHDNWHSPIASLEPVSAYARNKEIFSCPAEHATKPDAQGLYPLRVMSLEEPFDKSAFRISYAYLGDEMYGNQVLWKNLRDQPNVGVIACQWHGPLNGASASTSPVLKHLQPRTGPILRICFDGHLFTWNRRDTGSVTTLDYFYRPHLVNESLVP